MNFIVLLSWILPKAGARRAQKIFLTPTRVPRPASEADFYNSAKKYQFPHGIAAFEWGETQNPAVLLVHGWSGRGTQIGAFAAPLVKAGFRVIAIDGPAHGASDGQMTNVGEFANALMAVQKNIGPLHALIAHSFGAGCSIVAIQRGLQVKKAVLIAGPARYERVLANFFKLLPISPQAQEYFIVELQKKVGIHVKDLNVGHLGKSLPIEAMIVHDTEDKEVRFQSALEIQEVWPQAKLLRTEGLGHRRILRDPEVLRAVTEFIKS
ncbi:alpha/beta fold hydrolase [Bdellovibrio bacteriovorus]|nr:alpha/beta hydrolase [Bdellovibrio bacteriovorus]